jgi:adenosylhomocysteinase
MTKNNLPPHDVKDLSLAPQGKLKIEWAGAQMPVLRLIKERFQKEKPLKGITLGACLHITSETANLLLTLKSGGAQVAACACNPLSTQDGVAASLAKDYQIPVFAHKGENSQLYYKHINKVLDFHPRITMDDGGDLVSEFHKNRKEQLKELIGSCEETTTGVVRLRAMEKDKALKVPVVAVNDSDTKHMFDNRYGTGQSTIDGILRATNILLAGKVFVVCGYGWCSRGIAMRARGMGSNVVVTEVNPVRALEAAMDGFRVMSIAQAAKIGDIFVTATSDKNVISKKNIMTMKNGAILANSGHFNCEIDVGGLEKIATNKRKIRESLTEYIIGIRQKSLIVKRKPIPDRKQKKIYLLAEGRLVNLSAAEGHPAEVMDMSFANQALAAEYLAKNQSKLKAQVYVLPAKLDKMVASLKLKAMAVKIDRLTQEQKRYLSSWEEGT